jgi:hypothetical protein
MDDANDWASPRSVPELSAAGDRRRKLRQRVGKLRRASDPVEARKRVYSEARPEARELVAEGYPPWLVDYVVEEQAAKAAGQALDNADQARRLLEDEEDRMVASRRESRAFFGVTSYED